MADEQPQNPAEAVPPPEAPSENLSLSDHEAQYGSPWQAPAPPADAEPPADADAEPPRRGRRHSAKNQARAEDVPRIRELTRQKAELAAQVEAAKVTPPTSPAAEPVAATPPPVAPVAPPQRPQAAIPQGFPAFDAWLTIEGNANKSYDDYTDARADWRWAVNDAQRRQADHAQQRDSAIRQQMAAARTTYPDFDAVALAPTLPVTPVMHHAMLESDRGADILYHLGKNPALAMQIAQVSAQSGPDGMPPMKLYLESLLPSPAATTRHAGAPTGSPLALVPKPAPPPPNPVRTGVLTSEDKPPDTNASLKDHEAFYGTPNRRRR